MAVRSLGPLGSEAQSQTTWRCESHLTFEGAVPPPGCGMDRLGARPQRPLCQKDAGQVHMWCHKVENRVHTLHQGLPCVLVSTVTRTMISLMTWQIIVCCIRENANQDHSETHNTSTARAKMKNSDHGKCWHGCGRTGSLSHCW